MMQKVFDIEDQRLTLSLIFGKESNKIPNGVTCIASSRCTIFTKHIIH